MKIDKHKLSVGDKLSFHGVRALDRRWWPRFKAFILRRPPPRTAHLQLFSVTEMVMMDEMVKSIDAMDKEVVSIFTPAPYIERLK